MTHDTQSPYEYDITEQLQSLPLLTPPPETMTALRELAGVPDRRSGWHRPLAVAASVCVVMLAVLITVSDNDSTVPQNAAAPGRADTELISLLAHSVTLDRTLAALPREGRVQRVGTASTITALEDRVAVIDQRLNDVTAYASAGSRQALLRERVGLMRSLVSLRGGDVVPPTVWL